MMVLGGTRHHPLFTPRLEHVGSLKSCSSFIPPQYILHTAYNLNAHVFYEAACLFTQQFNVNPLQQMGRFFQQF